MSSEIIPGVDTMALAERAWHGYGTVVGHAMTYAKIANPLDSNGTKVDDRSRIIYNDWITVGSIPERVYDYGLGSRSAIAWVMESNRVRTDKASGIRNDPNEWAIEHNDASYILDLVGRVVTVAMHTLDIIDGLPSLEV